MERSRFTASASLILAIICALPQAQEVKSPYPSMAPLEQYLMGRDAEIALARSAAPDSISRNATILFLGKHGYETAAEGKNGFVCLVQRAWASSFASPAFWNPKNRAPVCYNPPAAHSVLPFIVKRTELVLAGNPKSVAQIQELEKAVYAKKELPTTVEPGGVAYMLSKDAYLTDALPHNLAHLMFITPVMEKEKWGANEPNSPVLLLQTGPPEPFTVFFVPTGKWSDGTAAPIP